MPYFKAMQETYAGGRLITPQYGGGTAQVEYEVFTGYRSSETQGMAFVNRHIIKAGMDSVVTALKRHGYYTQAMHPNVGSFYDRVYAYDAIGFDQLDFSDTMEGVEESATLTPYPSDEYLFGQIIKAYEERPKDQPWMCYALTYQNHGGYDYEGMTNRIQALDMPEGKEKRSLENYVNALHVSDEALRELLAYFEQQERPMMVIVWGDHSPNQKFFGVEMEAGVEKTELDYTTPYLVWSNYDLDTEALPDTLAAYRLGAYVLRLAGLGGDPYMDYLSSDGAANLFPAYGMLEEAGQVFVDEERYEEAVQQMRLLHYDRLDGENYGRGCP